MHGSVRGSACKRGSAWQCKRAQARGRGAGKSRGTALERASNTGILRDCMRVVWWGGGRLGRGNPGIDEHVRQSGRWPAQSAVPASGGCCAGVGGRSGHWGTGLHKHCCRGSAGSGTPRDTARTAGSSHEARYWGGPQAPAPATTQHQQAASGATGPAPHLEGPHSVWMCCCHHLCATAGCWGSVGSAHPRRAGGKTRPAPCALTGTYVSAWGWGGEHAQAQDRKGGN